jgi:putative spermidine/putrescine transport system ATP-binding protein
VSSGAGTLVLDRVTRRYEKGGRAAVDSVSLEVRAGELLALIGASGSGKTTTLRMAAGYEQPDEGSVVLVDGDGKRRDITDLPPQKRGFGMVFQHYALFPHMNVEENVAFGLEARSVAKRERLERARQALASVGLGGAGSRPVQSLSGGEQQRVALARALVIEPQVLLLDEPLSNLDPTLRQATRDELRAMLHRLQVTALFVTHDQEDAFAIADRVAMLRDGVLLQVGAPEDLYQRPASRHVAEFIGRATMVPARLGGDATVELSVHGSVQRAAPAADYSSMGQGPLLAVVRPENLEIVDGGTPGAWPGEVVGRRFAGDHTAYRVRLGDDRIVEVSTPDSHWREGDSVAVTVSGRPVAVVEG